MSYSSILAAVFLFMASVFAESTADLVAIKDTFVSPANSFILLYTNRQVGINVLENYTCVYSPYNNTLVLFILSRIRITALIV